MMKRPEQRVIISVPDLSLRRRITQIVERAGLAPVYLDHLARLTPDRDILILQTSVSVERLHQAIYHLYLASPRDGILAIIGLVTGEQTGEKPTVGLWLVNKNAELVAFLQPERGALITALPPLLERLATTRDVNALIAGRTPDYSLPLPR